MSAAARGISDNPASRSLSDEEPLLGQRGDASQPEDYGIYNNLFLGTLHRRREVTSFQLPAPSFLFLVPELPTIKKPLSDEIRFAHKENPLGTAILTQVGIWIV